MQITNWLNCIRTMRISFDHLDEYLSLFTPLDRRLHRTKIDIDGKRIRDFLSKLFQSRLKRHRRECFQQQPISMQGIQQVLSVIALPAIRELG